MVERCPDKTEADGSIPSTPTKRENFHVNLYLALFMKSSEQMGGSSEEPKEEVMEDKEGTPCCYSPYPPALADAGSRETLSAGLSPHSGAF